MKKNNEQNQNAFAWLFNILVLVQFRCSQIRVAFLLSLDKNVNLVVFVVFVNDRNLCIVILHVVDI